MSKALSIAQTMPVQGWMKTDECRAVFAALNDCDDEPRSLFVGGCVRNALLGCEVEDVDIATQLLPKNVTQRLENKGIKVIPTGLDHGTVTAVLNGRSFEITTLFEKIQ